MLEKSLYLLQVIQHDGVMDDLQAQYRAIEKAITSWMQAQRDADRCAQIAASLYRSAVEARFVKQRDELQQKLFGAFAAREQVEIKIDERSQWLSHRLQMPLRGVN